MKNGDNKTRLTPEEERRFYDWYFKVADRYGLSKNPDEPLHFYDFRGYWKDNKHFPFSGISEDGHFPDKWKTPGHPTFSKESVYYKDGMYAGEWDGDRFIIPQPTYDVYSDPKTYGARDKHLESLDGFIKRNPEIYGLNTSEFRDFMSALAGRESTYNKTAGSKQRYSGWYGLEGGSELSEDEQHRKAFKHLSELFGRGVITDADLEAGAERGYSPAQILYKYWNQGNNVTEYLHNGIAKTIGNNDDLRVIGNNIDVDMDYSKYLKNAIKDDYHVIEDGDTFDSVQQIARIPGRHYNVAGNDLIEYNNGKNGIFKWNEKNKKWEVRPISVGKDTVWFVDHSYAGGGPVGFAAPFLLAADKVRKTYLRDYINNGAVEGYPMGLGSWAEYLISPYADTRYSNNKGKDYDMARRALLSKYTGITDGLNFNPDDYLEESPYKPSNAKDPNAKYYRPKSNGEEYHGAIFGAVAGNYKVDKGEDENGRYASFYDVWDLAPFSARPGGNEIKGTTPIELYDRVYEKEDPFSYYMFFPGDKPSRKRDKVEYKKLELSDGGKIHIKKSKKGTFTAAANAHGKSVQAFASQVLANKGNYSPAMVKKANFARNAAKWHSDGGAINQAIDDGKIDILLAAINNIRNKKI